MGYSVLELYVNYISNLTECFVSGQCWDVRGIAGIGGYRAVLTLELWVDANQVN